MKPWHWATLAVFGMAVFVGMGTNDHTHVGPSPALVDWTEWIGSVAALIVAIFGMLKAVPSFVESQKVKRRANILRAAADAQKAQVHEDNIKSIINEGRWSQ